MPSTSTRRDSPAAQAASGSRTSSHAPDVSRSDLPAGAPSRSTPPSSASAAAAVRDRPSSRASAGVDPHSGQALGDRHRPLVISRSGASSPLTCACPTVSKSKPNSDKRTSRIAPPTTAGSATLNTGHQPIDRKSTTWPRSGPGAPEEPVDEVAQRPAEDHAEPDRPPRRDQSAAHPDDADHHTGRDQRQHPGVAGGHRERRAGIAHQRPGDGVTDDRHRLAGREQPDGEHLGDDVEGQNHGRRPSSKQPRRGGCASAGRPSAPLGRGSVPRPAGFVSHSPIIPRAVDSLGAGMIRHEPHRRRSPPAGRSPPAPTTDGVLRPTRDRRRAGRGLPRRRSRRPDERRQLAAHPRGLGRDRARPSERGRRGCRRRRRHPRHRHHGGDRAVAGPDLRRRRTRGADRRAAQRRRARRRRAAPICATRWRWRPARRPADSACW